MEASFDWPGTAATQHLHAVAFSMRYVAYESALTDGKRAELALQNLGVLRLTYSYEPCTSKSYSIVDAYSYICI